jgi:hypothetical protein
MNKKLRPRARRFYPGQLLGRLIATPQPSLATIIPTGRATLAFDPAFAAKLDSLFVALNPIFPAEHIGPTFTLPIIAGSALAPQGTAGTLRLGGDIEMLQLGGGQLFWREPWIELAASSLSAEAELDPSPPYPGKLGRIGALHAELAAAQLSAEPKTRRLHVTNLPLTLEATSASQMNAAFAQGGPPAFGAGEAVGAVSFVAVGG